MTRPATARPIDGFETRRVELPAGPIHYREAGAGHGDPIVFVHGFAVDGRLWEPVATRLHAAGHHCIVPDWPMGSHVEAMRPDADVTPGGVAAIIASFLEALDLDRVTIVGNDSGGAVTQLVVTRHPERIGRLVLTNCDAFDTFPPGHFRTMAAAMRLPGVTWLMVQSMRSAWLRRSPIAFGMLTRDPIDPRVLEEWSVPPRHDGGIRRDLRAFFTGASPALTREAAAKLPAFDRPAALVWGTDDRFFTIDTARRLQSLLPDARLVEVPRGLTFCPIEDGAPIAEAIGAFLADSSTSGGRTH